MYVGQRNWNVCPIVELRSLQRLAVNPIFANAMKNECPCLYSRYVCEQRKSSVDDDRMRPFDLPCLRAVAMLSQWL